MPFKSGPKHQSPSMARVDPDEQLVTTVYRHPFGILVLYAQVVLGLAAATGLLFFMLPQFVIREDNPSVYAFVGLVMVVVAVFMALILLVATVIYRQSRLIITNKNITEITQDGLFNRRISQLAVSNIEDATADRRGVFQTLLNFGILNIETAGETDNFYFYYCPEPDRYAKVVLELRESFLANRHRDNSEAGKSYAGPPLQPQQYAPMPQNLPSPVPQQGSYQTQQPEVAPIPSSPQQYQAPQYDYAPAPQQQPVSQPTPQPVENPTIPETDYRGPA